MSQKLYLVRINLEKFVGPMTANELKTSYRKMIFGLQDEVASSNRTWVAFDDLGKLRRWYPELLDLVQKDMLAGWASADTKLNVSRSKPARKTSMMAKLAVIALSALVAASGIYLARANNLASKLLAFKDSNLARANDYVKDRNWDRLEALVNKNRGEIVKAISDGRDLREWQPALRALAFANEGEVNGFPARMLMETDSTTAPKDCSVKAWKETWIASQRGWKDFVTGRNIPNTDWARILLWDPDWVKARRIAGWQDPRNYYEACILMALKALKQVVIRGNPQSGLKNVLMARLDWQKSIILDLEGSEEYSMSGSLWTLSCVESVTDRDYKNCSSNVSMAGDWDRLIKNRIFLGRLKSYVKKTASQDDLQAMKGLMDLWKPLEVSSGLQFDEEGLFFQTYVSEQGNLGATRDALRSRLSHIDLRSFP